MRATDLKIGMNVKFNGGNIVMVTDVPRPDKRDECFFSGILIETEDDFYKKWFVIPNGARDSRKRTLVLRNEGSLHRTGMKVA